MENNRVVWILQGKTFLRLTMSSVAMLVSFYDLRYVIR